MAKHRVTLRSANMLNDDNYSTFSNASETFLFIDPVSHYLYTTKTIDLINNWRLDHKEWYKLHRSQLLVARR